MRTVILAGGFGTRLSEETDRIPKPMVEIGGRPMLWHIMQLYGAVGLKHFVVALGYKGDVIKNYFLTYRSLESDVTVSMATGEVASHRPPREDWTVDLIGTGLETNTGGRVGRLAAFLPDERFCLTYGDGLADVDLTDLMAFHAKHGKAATVTAIRPPSRFGGLVMEDDLVVDFTEKPQIGEGWINGGFMVLERSVLDLIDGDGTSFEADVLEQLAQNGELMAYRHERFWQSMDTLRDVRLLQSLWDSGEAPWRTWG